MKMRNMAEKISKSRHNSETASGDFHTLDVRPDLQIEVLY